MKEQEYIDTSDLERFKIIRDILDNCLCFDDPNKTRLMSVKQNIRLMIDDLGENIELSLKDKL